MADVGTAREAAGYIPSLEEEKKMKVITLLWHWWLERNRVREGEQRMEPSKIAYVVGRNSD
jgi:hypothetical protein